MDKTDVRTTPAWQLPDFGFGDAVLSEEETMAKFKEIFMAGIDHAYGEGLDFDDYAKENL